MRILITGGAGYIGSVLTERLLTKTNHLVTVYDNLMYGQQSLFTNCFNPRFNFLFGDVADQQVLKQALDNSDIIIPLAAIVGFPACEQFQSLATTVNYDQISYICDNLTPSQMLIYPNTNSGYGIKANGICDETTPLNPISHYGITKVMAEKKVLSSTNGVVMRLATVFGPSTRIRTDLLVNDFTYKAVTDGYVVIFEKDFKRNFIHILDVADAFIFMIENYNLLCGNVFNIGISNCNLSKLQLAEKIKYYVPNFSIYCDDIKSDPDKRDYIISNDKIESAGFHSQYTLDDGIPSLIKAYKLFIRHYANI